MFMGQRECHISAEESNHLVLRRVHVGKRKTKNKTKPKQQQKCKDVPKPTAPDVWMNSPWVVEPQS